MARHIRNPVDLKTIEGIRTGKIDRVVLAYEESDPPQVGGTVMFVEAVAGPHGSPVVVAGGAGHFVEIKRVELQGEPFGRRLACVYW